MKELILGTAQIGFDYGITNNLGVPDEQEIYQIKELIKKYKIKKIDTADSYGKAQNIISRVFNEQGYDVVTKLKISQLQNDSHFKKALINLNLAKIHGLLIHDPENIKTLQAKTAIEIMKDLKLQNLINKIGVSVYSESELDLALENFPELNIIQIPANVLNLDVINSNLVKQLTVSGVEIQIRSVFLQGLLLEEPGKLPNFFESIEEPIRVLEKLSKLNEMSRMELLLSVIKFHNAGSGVVIGAASSAQLMQICTAWNNCRPIEFDSIEVTNNGLLDPEKLVSGKEMILGILQARTSSTRLPGKVLADIHGKPMILRQIDRISYSKKLDKLIVATSDNPTDDYLVDILEKNKINYFRGSLSNVLERFISVGEIYNPDVICRLTADCPLIDPNIIDLVINTHLFSGASYTSNTLNPTYPDGLDVECVNFDVLKNLNASSPSQKECEHVTFGIYTRENFCSLKSVENGQDFSKLRWTVDIQEDLEFVRKIYAKFLTDGRMFSMEEIIEFLSDNPHLNRTELSMKRNAGLLDEDNR